MLITLHTSLGDITLTLDFENTPKSAQNFLEYAESGFYNGTIFHRVIDGFMIQGGGFKPKMIEKTTRDTIDNEADKAQPNARGTIAFARTSDPHSASAQFFINVKDNPFLNHSAKTTAGWGYCVFGSVTDGMEIVDKIRQVNTTTSAGHGDVPVEDIIIEKTTVEKKTPA